MSEKQKLPDNQAEVIRLMKSMKATIRVIEHLKKPTELVAYAYFRSGDMVNVVDATTVSALEAMGMLQQNGTFSYQENNLPYPGCEYILTQTGMDYDHESIDA